MNVSTRRTLRRAMRALLGAAALAFAASALAETVVDDRGRVVTLEHPPKRIVTLSPHLAEVAFAAGAGERVVGVSVFSDYPPEVTRLPQIEASGRVDLERVVRLAPDLALAWRGGNRVQDLERLERLGIPVYATEARRLADVSRVLRAVGKLAGSPAEGEAAATAFEQSMSALRERYKGRSPVRVFYEVWHEPLMTVSGAHLVSDLLDVCGAENVFDDAQTLIPAVSAEQLYARNPDVVVVSGVGLDDAAALERWKRFSALPAVRAGRVYAIDASLANRMGPRVSEGAAALCELTDRARR
ncbi:MAG: cobalamin-binding protein [Betaproteobacteria bacterium]|nr:cobalamin-binding protein [Betaproteobacteria bacterium]